MQNHNDTIIKTSEDFFKKNIPLTLLKGFVCVRGSWRLNKDCSILTSPAPPDITVCRSRSPGLLNRGPGGPASLEHVLIPASSHQLVWYPNSIGVPKAPSAGWWLSLPHLVANPSDLQLTVFLSSPSYIIVQSPAQYLFSGLARPEYATSGVFGLACLIIIKWK